MKKLLFLLAGLLILGAAGVLLASDLPATNPRETAVPARAISPMMAEIQANLASVRSRVEDLGRRYHESADEELAQEISREISRIKGEGRVEMLRIQLRYARQEGRGQVAAELETAIAKMTAPPTRGEPRPRPAPQRDGRP